MVAESYVTAWAGEEGAQKESGLNSEREQESPRTVCPCAPAHLSTFWEWVGGGMGTFIFSVRFIVTVF